MGAGKSISENIVECISKSSRVLLLISRKYMSSSWCQYEVQISLTQLHKRRRHMLLIPVLLEDVTKKQANNCGNVDTILSVITGIHAPPKDAGIHKWTKLWNKLDEAFPSRKD